MEPSYQFSCYTGAEGLEALEGEWQSLFQRVTNPVFYNDIRWHRAMQKHLFTQPIYYVIARSQGRPIAIIPLQHTQRAHAGIKTNYLHLPHHPAADLRDIVLDAATGYHTLYGSLMQYLRSEFPAPWEVIEWRNFTERSALCRLISSAHPLQSLETEGHSQYVVASPDLSLLDTVSPKQIRNAERLLRKTQSQLPVSHNEFVNQDEIIRGFERFISVEQAGWKGEQGSAIAQNKDRQAFYRELATSFSVTGQTSIRLMRIGEIDAAGQFGLRSGNKLLLLKIGYNEDLSAYGPGSTILLKCLQDETNKNTEELNLVTGPSWATRWHFQSEPTFRFLDFNTSLLSKALMLGRKYKRNTHLKRKDHQNANT